MTEPIRRAISTQRRRERRDKRREGKTSWRPGTESASQAYSSLRFLCVLCVSALSGPFRFSRDASHADQVAEDHAFQGLRGGDAGVAAAAAHRHGLQAGRVLVEGARVPLARGIVEIPSDMQ